MTAGTDWLRPFVRAIPDFPEPGVSFKDISPLLADPDALRFAIDWFADQHCGQGIDLIAGIEARGFLFATAIAYRMGVGAVMIRKPGKLPGDKIGVDYALEYGTDRIEMHADAMAAGQRVLIFDDVLATGGTGVAAVELVRAAGAEVAAIAVLIELEFLGGAARFDGVPISRLLQY